MKSGQPQCLDCIFFEADLIAKCFQTLTDKDLGMENPVWSAIRSASAQRARDWFCQQCKMQVIFNTIQRHTNTHFAYWVGSDLIPKQTNVPVTNLAKNPSNGNERTDRVVELSGNQEQINLRTVSQVDLELSYFGFNPATDPETKVWPCSVVIDCVSRYLWLCIDFRQRVAPNFCADPSIQNLESIFVASQWKALYVWP